jgi:hypothetical protein
MVGSLTNLAYLKIESADGTLAAADITVGPGHTFGYAVTVAGTYESAETNGAAISYQLDTSSSKDLVVTVAKGTSSAGSAIGWSAVSAVTIAAAASATMESQHAALAGCVVSALAMLPLASSAASSCPGGLVLKVQVHITLPYDLVAFPVPSGAPTTKYWFQVESKTRAPTSSTPTTGNPSAVPSQSPLPDGQTHAPTTSRPSRSPASSSPSAVPTSRPTTRPTTASPSRAPIRTPTQAPLSGGHTHSPFTASPIPSPTSRPSQSPTIDCHMINGVHGINSDDPQIRPVRDLAYVQWYYVNDKYGTWKGHEVEAQCPGNGIVAWETLLLQVAALAPQECRDLWVQGCLNIDDGTHKGTNLYGWYAWVRCPRGRD